MKKITLIFIFLTYSITNAQFNFSSHTIMENSNTSEGVQSIQNVDIDGDGDKDLLSGDIYNVKWFENNDGHNTQLVSHKITDFGVEFCSFADIDGDEDMDVVLHKSAGGLYWAENSDGRGNFYPPELLFDGSYSNPIYSISIVDFDNDNDIDILLSYNSASSASLRWLENTNGQGNFTSNVIPKYNTFSRAINAVDIDNDSDVDIFSFNNNTQKIECFINNGGLNFTTRIITDAKNNGYATINFADIDNDTDLDLIATNSDIYTISLEEIKIFKNDGLGNLLQHQLLLTTGIDISYLVTKDLDNDNDLDIVFSSYDNDKVVWFKNNDGQGNYAGFQVVNTNLNGAKCVTAYDFDGDGDNDIVAASEIEDKIVWHSNSNGQANFGTETILTRSINMPLSAIYRDIDGDGDLDVVSASDGDGKIAWYKNLDGQGNFGPQNIISADLYSTRVVETSDLDQDGDLDIITGESHSTQSKFVWYENLDGQGHFDTEKNMGSGYIRGLNGLKAADLDNDGDNDIIYLTQWVETTIDWLENTGQENFTPRSIPLSTNETAGEFLLADINNDGKKDIVLLGYKLTWYANNGSGNFTEQIVDSNFYDAFSCDVADFDGDGDMDIVSFQQRVFNSNYSIGWYENLDGNGSFGPINTITSFGAYGGYEENVYAADLDSDGDSDIIAGYNNGGKLEWYENLDGQANFAQKSTFINQNGFKLLSVALDDVNQDGYVDVLSSMINDDYLNPVPATKIVYFKNLGLAFNKINGFVRAGLNTDDCNLPTNNLKVITNNGTDTFTTFTTKTGYYQFYVDPGSYTTTLPSSLNYYNISAPASHTSNFTNVGNIDVANFCLYPSQNVNDLNVVLIPLNEARPGFVANYQIIFNNVGTSQLNGTVTLNFDNSKLFFESATSAPNSQTENSLTFNYSNFMPFETRTINVAFQVATPPTVEINDVLVFTVAINPIANDYTNIDNEYVLNQTVIGSFDPNDITCLEGERIILEQTEKDLHYVIRFQNTGTASAINVKIENILNDNLDWNTFQILNSSHNNRVEIKNGNRLSFILNNIHLPHSSANETESHGFIAYKIKAKSNVEVGDVIPNQASIFFDYNLPIVTNEALTEIVEEDTPNSETPLEDIEFYPMPVTDVLTIDSKTEIIKIELYNLLGQMVVNTNQNVINLSNLMSGVYLCKVTDKNNRIVTKKILKR